MDHQDLPSLILVHNYIKTKMDDAYTSKSDYTQLGALIKSVDNKINSMILSSDFAASLNSSTATAAKPAQTTAVKKVNKASKDTISTVKRISDNKMVVLEPQPNNDK